MINNDDDAKILSKRLLCGSILDDMHDLFDNQGVSYQSFNIQMKCDNPYANQ
jgi:hypothetical protein